MTSAATVGVAAGEVYDVVVVGAGPAGLTAASLLGSYGIRVLLVERNASTVREPRAVSIDDEALRTLQAIGVVETVLATIVPGYGSEYVGPSRRVFLTVRPTDTPYGYPRRNAFRQPLLESQLRQHLLQLPTVETRFRCRAEAISQDADSVLVTLQNADGSSVEARSRYLIGADGASSFVRNALGLSLEGDTFSEQWLIIDLENSVSPSKQTYVYCDADRPFIALPGPNETRRFEFKLRADEDLTRICDDDVVAEFLQLGNVSPGSRVVRKTVYTFHARLAQCWSQGRVFLVGDACHLTPPFAGQGMNSGLRDAHNLAWKLAWVLQHGPSAGLLGSYETERRPHVAGMIQLALRMGRIMAPRHRAIGWLTRSAFHLLTLWPGARDYFAQMKYKPKARFAQGFLVPDGQSARSTPIGRLIPQPLVLTARGPQRLDEVLGRGFALLALSSTAAALRQVASDPFLATLAPAQVLVCAVPRSDVAQGCMAVVDSDGVLAQFLGTAEEIFVLVRPDKYVMAAFGCADVAPVAARIASFLQDPAEVVFRQTA